MIKLGKLWLILCIIISFSAKGEVKYTKLNELWVTKLSSVSIDFDGDKNGEFILYDKSFDDEFFPGCDFYESGESYGFIMNSEMEQDQVKALAKGAVIDGKSGFHNNGVDAWIYADWYKDFPVNQEAYIGAQFKLGGNVHYGWIAVNWNGISRLKVNGYAYETEPGNPIHAGEIPVNVVLTQTISVKGQGGSQAVRAEGGTLQLHATTLPKNTTDKSVSWSVINETGEATISSTGLLTGVKAGKVTVKAIANDQSRISGTLWVDVVKADDVLARTISVQGVNGKSVVDVEGGQLQMEAIVLPLNTTKKNVHWWVTNETGYATISSGGLLTGTRAGTVLVSAYTTDGTVLKGETRITISDMAPTLVNSVEVISLTGSNEIPFAGAQLQLVANTFPINASNGDIKWDSWSETQSGFVFNNGFVVGLKPGIINVRAIAKDRSGVRSDLYTITVKDGTPEYITSIAVQGAAGQTKINDVGKTLQMEASILPVTATLKTIIWEVINGTGAATISHTGVLTATRAGNVTVLAKAIDGTNITGSTTINIQDPGLVLVKSMDVHGKDGNCQVKGIGGTLQMEAEILPENATIKQVAWKIVNGTGEASITATGLLTGIKAGTVTVIALSNDGTNVSSSAEVIINEVKPVLVEAVSIQNKDDELEITGIGKTLQMNAEVSPIEATDQSVSWIISGGTGEATIDDAGLLTSVKAGTVIVTAIANDHSGRCDSKTIMIHDPNLVLIESITTESEDGVNEIAEVGETIQMGVNILPENASDKSVTWVVTNETGKASISKEGLLTGIEPGTVTVTACANDISGKSHSTTITIQGELIIRARSVFVQGLNGNSVIEKEGGILQMEAIVLPDGTTKKNVNWWVTNETGSATITSGGLLVSHKAGTVLVEAYSTDGTVIKGESRITILDNPPTLVNQISVRGVKDVHTLPFPGARLQMLADVLPMNATNPLVQWRAYSITGKAFIGSDGLLIGLEPGLVRIVARATDGSGIKGQLDVMINNQIPVFVKSLTIDVSGVPANKLKSELLNTDRMHFVAKVLPANASLKTVHWSVTNGTGAAVITHDGWLRVTKSGTVRVTAVCNDGSGTHYSVVLNVSRTDQVTALTSVESSDIAVLSVYPNPASDHINVEVNAPQKIQSVKIYSLDGQVVMTKMIKGAKGSLVKLNISSLNPGTYVLAMTSVSGDKFFRKIQVK